MAKGDGMSENWRRLSGTIGRLLRRGRSALPGRGSVIVSRISGWVRRRRLDDEFTEELHAHLSLLIDEYVRRGIPADEAGRAARLQLGGITQLREARRDSRGLPLLDMLGQDVR